MYSSLHSSLSSKRSSKQTDLNIQTLKHSNSDTNLFILIKKEKTYQSKCDTETKNVTQQSKKRYKSRDVRLGIMLSKEKKRLKDYIVNNAKYVKLFGNKRYKNNSPFLYVQDQKKKIDDKKSGLIPVPNKSRKKIKSQKEEKELYELQRSIVMIRRYMYNHNIVQDLSHIDKNNFIDFLKLQKWWNENQKIVKIQKYVRGWLIRKNYIEVKNFGIYLKYLEQKILSILARQALLILFRFIVYKKEVPPIGLIHKKSLFLSHKLLMYIIKIQSHIIKHQTRKKYLDYIDKHAKKIKKSSFFYFNKISYSKDRLICLLNRIKRKWKQFLLKKSRLILKKINPQVITKIIKTEPSTASKRIQGWIKRHHYFVCNDKKESICLHKEKEWNYFTKTLIDSVRKEKLFIKPKPPLNPSDIMTFNFSIKPCYITKTRKVNYDNKIRIIQAKVKYGIITIKPLQFKQTINFIDKYYLNRNTQVMIKFNKNIKNILIKHFFKKKITYVPYNLYSNKEVLLVNNIQRRYRTYFYSKSINILKKIVNSPEIIEKNRLISAISLIIKIQRNFRKYYIKKTKLDFKALNRYNFLGYLTKKVIINVDSNLERITFNIKRYLILKNIKKENNNIVIKKKPKTTSQVFICKSIRSNLLQEISSVKKLQSKVKTITNKTFNNSLIYYQKKESSLLTSSQSNKRPYYDKNSYYISKKRINIIYQYHKINIKGVNYIDKKRYVNIEKNLVKLQKIIKLFLIHPIRINLNNEDVSSIKDTSTKLYTSRERKTMKSTESYKNYKNLGIISKVYKKNQILHLEKIQTKYKSHKQKGDIYKNAIKKEKSIGIRYLDKIIINQSVIEDYKKYIEDLNIIQLDCDYKNKAGKRKNDKEVCYVKKIYIKDNTKMIIFIQKEFRKYFQAKKIIQLPKKNFGKKDTSNLLEKNNYQIYKTNKNNINDNLSQITLIQKSLKHFIKSKREKIKIEKANLFISKPIISKNTLSKNYIINVLPQIIQIQKYIQQRNKIIQEKGKYISIPSTIKNDICFINKKLVAHPKQTNHSHIYCYISKKTYFTQFEDIKKIIKLQQSIKKYLISFHYNKKISSYEKVIGQNEIEIISEKHPKQIFKCINNGTYITRMKFKILHNPKDISFVQLLTLFAIKNSQELIFEKLKKEKVKQIKSSFFLRTLKQLYNYFNDNKEDNSKVKQFFSKIGRNEEKNESLSFNKVLIALTSPKILKMLHNTNIYSSFEDDLTEFLSSFSEYAYNYCNPKFFSQKLKTSNLTNTNIFSLIQFVNIELTNLLNNQHCSKSVQFRENSDNNITDEEDDLFGELTSKEKKVEYDSIRCGGTIIHRRPKIEEEYEDPLTQIYSNSMKANGNSNTKNSHDENKNYDSIANSVDIFSTKDSTTKEVTNFKRLIHENNTRNKKNLIIRNTSSFN